MAGASVAYAIGYFGRRELFERQGAKMHMGATRLDRAERWFGRRGAPVIFVSRLIPFGRAVFPYAAGVAKMPFGRFFALATLGSIAWISGLGILGREVGSNWQSWRRHLEYADYAVVAILVLVIVYVVLRRVRARPKGRTVDALSK
jgi:membrane protein DedA with SNARE-associated domain